jgi:intracellular septation protein
MADCSRTIRCSPGYLDNIDNIDNIDKHDIYVIIRITLTISRMLQPVHILADFLPMLLFLGTYIYEDLYFAITVLMFAMPISLGIKWIMTRKVDRMYLGSTIALLIFGGAALYFRNPYFLFWKPTVLNWAIAVVCLGSQWIGAKPIVRRMFGEVATLTAEQWTKLNLSWVVFFIVAGILNIYVAYNFSEEFWVNFKVFGLMGLSLLFIVGQTIWMSQIGALQTEPSDEEI